MNFKEMFQDMKELSEGAIPSKSKPKITLNNLKIAGKTGLSMTNVYKNGAINLSWRVSTEDEEALCRVGAYRSGDNTSYKDNNMDVDIDVFHPDYSYEDTPEEVTAFYKKNKKEIDVLVMKEFNKFISKLPMKQ